MSRKQNTASRAELIYNAGLACLLRGDCSFVVPPVVGPHRLGSISLNVLCQPTDKNVPTLFQIGVIIQPQVRAFTAQVIPGPVPVARQAVSSTSILDGRSFVETVLRRNKGSRRVAACGQPLWTQMGEQLMCEPRSTRQLNAASVCVNKVINIK